MLRAWIRIRDTILSHISVVTKKHPSFSPVPPPRTSGCDSFCHSEEMSYKGVDWSYPGGRRLYRLKRWNSNVESMGFRKM